MVLTDTLLNGNVSSMEELQKYLNSLPPIQQVRFAKKCETTVGYLRKCISTGQTLGAKICSLIEEHSEGAVTRKQLHPQDWRVIWPELARKKAA